MLFLFFKCNLAITARVSSLRERQVQALVQVIVSFNKVRHHEKTQPGIKGQKAETTDPVELLASDGLFVSLTKYYCIFSLFVWTYLALQGILKINFLKIFLSYFFHTDLPKNSPWINSEHMVFKVGTKRNDFKI